MSAESDLQARTRGAGQILFVLAALAGTLLLLSQIGTQTAWVDSAKSLPAQPRFWPAVGLVLMAVPLAVMLWQSKRRLPQRADWIEAKRWLEPVEYAVWFMAYVFLVPLVGFLPMSLLFAPLLTWRLGYRGPVPLWLSVIFAVALVVLFKGLLGVKIPGAAIYDALPDSLRAFALQYL